jgi:uncharacterized membrane protein YebE (DUF533 family)
MNAVARETGAHIEYQWEEGGETRSWVASTAVRKSRAPVTSALKPSATATESAKLAEGVEEVAKFSKGARFVQALGWAGEALATGFLAYKCYRDYQTYKKTHEWPMDPTSHYVDRNGITVYKIGE